MILRPYQLDLIDAVWQEILQSQTALAQLPTGGGKTLCFSHLLKKAMDVKPDIRAVILMGRIDLVLQTERAIAQVIDRRHIGVYCGSLGRKELSRPITVASIQSIGSVRPSGVNLIIVDEVHNMDQGDGAYIRFIRRAEEANPRVKVVGFTATPFRARGPIHGEGMMFRRLCYRKTIQDMIALGFLCRPILKQSDNAFDTSNLRVRAGEYVQEDVDALVANEDMLNAQVTEALGRMAGRGSVAWATANIDHCNRVLDALGRMGEYATSVHSKQGRDTRGANLAQFMGGACHHIVFVSVLSEGFDHPPIDCIVLMRPTRSPVLYVQTVGRGLRISGGKADCLVLDYGQVVRELGPLDDPRVKGKKDENGKAVLKVCPSCASYVPGGYGTCPDCGYAFPAPPAPEEKLTRRSDDTAKILSEAQRPVTETLGPAVIEMHEAKSGNICVKITYRDGCENVWGGHSGVHEYFVTTSPWAMERLERRLVDIGARLPSIPFWGEVEAQGTFEVVKTKDGKYDRVMSVRRVAEANPNRVGFEEDGNASFDFGCNAPATSPTEVGF